MDKFLCFTGWLGLKGRTFSEAQHDVLMKFAASRHSHRPSADGLCLEAYGFCENAAAIRQAQ